MHVTPNFHKSQLLLFLGSLMGIFILTFSITSGRAMLLEGQAADATTDVTMVIQNKMDVMNVDGEEILSTPDIAWYGNGKTANQSALGLRFTGESVPAQATIISAKIGLTSAKNQWISVATAWSAENQVAPQFYGVGDNLLSRTLLPSQKSYTDNKRWMAEKTYYYDVTDIVKAQQAVSKSAGSNGQNTSAAISFIIKGAGRPWARKYFYANPAFGKSPVLSIKYSLGTGATPVPIIQPTATPMHSMIPTPTPTLVPTPPPTGQPIPTLTPAPTTSPIPNMPPTSQSGTDSMAMGRWTPAAQDTCTKAEHDSFSAVGPDGKKYPTWHPPVMTRTNGTTCTFGHEHGRNPAGSKAAQLVQAQYGGILFGYGNEMLDEYNVVNSISNGMRHEDHVGHKIEWENGVVRTTNNCANTPASPGCFSTTASNVTCDFFMKVHQGTHSVDAFANNIHELVYAVSCSDGAKLVATKMVIFGKPGEFVDNDGKSRVVKVGSAVPANSPSNSNSVRFIPTNVGVSNQILVPQGQWSLYSNGLYEDWVSSNYLTAPNASNPIAYFDPHFAVFGPSRYHDPSAPGTLRRSIDVCYLTENNGTERARGGECDALTNYGQNMTPVAFDDPRSPFNGVKREFYFNQTKISNKNGPTAWYTDPYGRDARTTAAPGFIKQFVAAIDNSTSPTFESDAIGGDRWYGGQGVHAPN